MDKEHYDYLLKFIVIGNSNTGKSCLLHYFLENKFKRNSSHTIGVEFGSKIIKIGTKTIKLQIWDTAGQERFRSVARSYYRGALGALVVFDTTNAETFAALPQWIKDAKDLARPDICISIVGNKNDLKDERVINYMESAKFSQENSVNFLETSALTGENVNESFVCLAKNILAKIENGLFDTNDIQPKIMSNLSDKNKSKTPDGRCSKCLY